MKGYIQKHNYDKAIEIGRKFLDDAIIVSQMITIYIKRRDYDVAKELGRNFPNDPVIQSQMAKRVLIVSSQLSQTISSQAN